MKYIVLAFICLSAGTCFGYIIGAMMTLNSIREYIEEFENYAERDRYIKS